MQRSTATFLLVGLAAVLSAGLWALLPRSGSDSGAPHLVIDASGQRAAAPDGAGGETAGPAPFDKVLAVSTSAGRSELPVAKEMPAVQRATVEIELLGLPDPVAGALVIPGSLLYARRPPEKGAPGVTPDGSYLANHSHFEADADGKLTLEVAPLRQDTLSFTWPTSSWRQEITWRSPRAGAKETLRVRFPLAREDLSLLVRSFPSGAALEGAFLSVGSASVFTLPKDGEAHRSDRLGALTAPKVSGPTRDPYTLTLSAEGHSSESIRLPAPVNADPSEGAPVTVWLTQDANLSGTVALAVDDGSGRKRSRATVYLVPRSGLRSPQGSGESELANAEERLPAELIATGVTVDIDQVREQGQVQFDGTWSMKGIDFPDRDQPLKDHVLVLLQGTHGSVLAEGVSIGPGDELVINDSLLEGPSLRLAFTLADGRPAISAGVVTLRKTSPPGVDASGTSLKPLGVRGYVATNGQLSFPGLALGEWSWTLQNSENGVIADGTLMHTDGAETQRVVHLAGYTDVEGQVEGQRSAAAYVYWTVASRPEELGGYAYSDGSGRFRIPLVPVGETLHLVARTRSRPRNLTGKPKPPRESTNGTVAIVAPTEGLKGVAVQTSTRDDGASYASDSAPRPVSKSAPAAER